MGTTMSVSEATREILRKMGLNAYETDAYLALLEGGQLTAMAISGAARVPYSKIYEVLNSLKQKSWIKSTESRPSEYYPVQPLEAATAAKSRFEDEYQKWEQVLAKELQPLYEKRELVERPDILILHGQQAVLAKLEEVLKTANREIMIAAPSFARQLIALVESPLNGVRKNIQVNLLAAGQLADWQFLKKVAGITHLRFRDHMFGGGVIADGKEAMLFLGEDKPSLVIWSNHVGLVGFAREYFQFLWDSSTSA
jgi:HTH-type transcriptional regulator, sugar sensing transcriptional regulator